MKERGNEGGEFASVAATSVEGKANARVGEFSAGLGAQIRAARAAAGISVRGLAGRINVSPSFVSQVELGQARPAIGTLYAIASELGLSLDELMKDAGTPADTRGARETMPSAARAPELNSSGSVLTRGAGVGEATNFQPADSRATISVGDVIWERLTPHDDPHVDFLRVTYPPGSESCSEDNLQRHGGWEYGHVLEGQLDVQVMFTHQVVGAGESVNFDSGIPHRLSNPHDEVAIAIWVVVGRQSPGAR